MVDKKQMWAYYRFGKERGNFVFSMSIDLWIFPLKNNNLFNSFKVELQIFNAAIYQYNAFLVSSSLKKNEYLLVRILGTVLHM